MNHSLKIFLYISGWVTAWLVLSSIIDYGLIETNVYAIGEKGKLVTFSIGAVISFAGAYSLYKEVFPK